MTESFIQRETDRGLYTARVVVTDYDTFAFEQVHFWNQNNEHRVLHSCSFEKSNLGQAALEDIRLKQYCGLMLATVIRQHDRGQR